MTQPLQDQTNQITQKQRPGRPRKNNGNGELREGSNTDPTLTAVLEKLQQLEACIPATSAARDVENAQLRAELAAAQRNQVTPTPRPLGTTDSDLEDIEGTGTRGNHNNINNRDGAQANDLFNDEDSPTPPAQRRRAQDEDNDMSDTADRVELRAQKRRRLEQLVNQRRERGTHTPADPEYSHTDSNPNSTTRDSQEDYHRKIPKPQGQAQKDYSLAVKMGLSKSRKSRLLYNALLRAMRDAVSASRIPWQKEWANIDAADEAMLFAVMRERNAFLKRFQNEWASEAMVRQYLKNKRKRHYQLGTLEVPQKYEYLKDNASKRDQSKTRKRRALQDYNQRKARTRAAKKRGRENRRTLMRLSKRMASVSDQEDEQLDFVEGSSRDGMYNETGQNDDGDITQEPAAEHENNDGVEEDDG
ncbi:hypothetical protein K435DRAFT_905802 [Dendrothele bispora CBS 962.96]|uniref:Uncharacterized protein n=1 Tax=Dendrothele bispora (strain CBS 962.96) TaxID=1314807 RepID=A0A4S8KK95_DENBC|nr:hypothetical protein K435DRAFT_905802 [Dendrothele bispora CBS 962.96]